jgi:hypothetical protein
MDIDVDPRRGGADVGGGGGAGGGGGHGQEKIEADVETRGEGGTKGKCWVSTLTPTARTLVPRARTSAARDSALLRTRERTANEFCENGRQRSGGSAEKHDDPWGRPVRPHGQSGEATIHCLIHRCLHKLWRARTLSLRWWAVTLLREKRAPFRSISRVAPWNGRTPATMSHQFLALFLRAVEHPPPRRPVF